MTGSTHLRQPGLLSGVFHFVIIGVAAQADDAGVWPYAFIAMSVVSFFSWLANFHRYRQIVDLPTSKVASAAQGYVELFGKSEMVDGEAIISQLSGTPCCWYSYQIEEKNSKNEWSVRDSGQSVRHFHLVDGTGKCVISPDGAEVLTKDGRIWESGSERYTEWMLLPNSVLYAIGEFCTGSAVASSVADETLQTGALLTEWKQNQARLLERFDLDKDGRIDMKEWELARLQARREIRKQLDDAAPRPVEGTHLLRKPADGRLFLLANEMPDKLGARYRFWSWVHLAIFIGLGSTGLVML
jgi:hypothetical protein